MTGSIYNFEQNILKTTGQKSFPDLSTFTEWVSHNPYGRSPEYCAFPPYTPVWMKTSQNVISELVPSVPPGNLLERQILYSRNSGDRCQQPMF